MSFKNLEDVLYHGMKDLLSAEKQFRDALPKLAECAEDPELSDAFREHREETLTQIDRLERGFALLGRAERSEKCKAADGLVAEGDGIVEEDGEAPAKDVMLTAAGRKVEHYEIASYEDCVRWARLLGQDELAALLEETLQEEKAASKKLAAISERLAEKAPQPVSH